MEYRQLSYEEQLQLFATRGCIDLQVQLQNKDKNNSEADNYARSLRTISSIGYYQLKNYSYPYFKNNEYENITFSGIVARYYRDKKLRYATLHAIEDIEATLNTRIAMLLGERYGSLGYLDFFKWCQTSGCNPFLNYQVTKFKVAKEQNAFLSRTLKAMKQSQSLDVKTFEKRNPHEPYLPVWLLMNELTLGESIHIFRLMSKENRREIAKAFNADVTELSSWLSCINLVRNICCHNGNLADLKLKTKPKIPKEYKEFLAIYDREKFTYTNRYTVVVCIIIRMMKEINPKYRFDNLASAIQRLLDETTNASYYGFRDTESLIKLFNLA